MASLTEPQKLFIVRALACYDSPSRVAAAVREEFGIDIDRRRIQEYDPERAGSRGIGKKLRAVFEETRRQFKEKAGEVPIAHKAVRLRSLNRMFEKAEVQGNMVFAAQLLEQAAKEVGGMFTNRRELTGAAGGPIQQATSVSTMSDEQLIALIKDLNEAV
jgi:hypothetical protein